MAPRTAVWLFALAALTGCTKSRPSSDNPGAADADAPNRAIAEGLVTVPEDGVLSPPDYLALVEGSPRRYRIVADPGASTDLRGNGVETPLVRPDLERRVGMAGFELREIEVPDGVAAAVQGARTALDAGDPRSALTSIEAAVTAEPSFGPGRRLQAQALLALGRAAEAIEILIAVTEENPIDQQAHRLLGRAMLEGGRARDALGSAVRAYVLDPHHREGVEILKEAARRNGREFVENRVRFPYSVTIVTDGTIELRIGGDMWITMAACDATWRHEPELRDFEEPPGTPPGFARTRACLIATSESIAALSAGGRQADPDAAALIALARGGLLKPILYWEYVAHRDPERTLTYPPELIDEIEAYLLEWVIPRG